MVVSVYCVAPVEHSSFGVTPSCCSFLLCQVGAHPLLCLALWEARLRFTKSYWVLEGMGVNSTVSDTNALSVLIQTRHVCWWSTESLVRPAAASPSQPCPSQCFCICPSLLSSLSVPGKGFTVLYCNTLRDSDQWLPQANLCCVDVSDASAAVTFPSSRAPLLPRSAGTLLAAYLSFIKDYRQTKSEKNNKSPLFSTNHCLIILVEQIHPY